MSSTDSNAQTGQVRTELVRSTQSLDFDAWARRLVEAAILVDAERTSATTSETKRQPSTAA